MKKLSRAKKMWIIIGSSVAAVALACLIGLIATGAAIGWGPFQDLKWNNIKQYVLSEKEYSYTMEEKTIMCDGQKIKGTLYLSDNGYDKQEIVIVSHGYASISKSNMYACKSLAKSGITCFSFDYRGGAPHSESDGKTTDMSILTEAKDLNAVIDEVKTWDFVDTDKITVMGYSQGGIVGGLVASERDDIAKLLLVYPAFSAIEELKSDYSSIDAVPQTVKRLGMTIGKIYYADVFAMDYDIYEKVSEYQGETLIIHGTADKLVPYESSVKAAEMYGCELYTIEGAGHGFENTKYDKLFLQKAYEFFTE
ncbi:MAG: alpha/beta hydrolase [Candidatus Coproplasma sp.]